MRITKIKKLMTGGGEVIGTGRDGIGRERMRKMGRGTGMEKGGGRGNAGRRRKVGRGEQKGE